MITPSRKQQSSGNSSASVHHRSHSSSARSYSARSHEATSSRSTTRSCGRYGATTSTLNYSPSVQDKKSSYSNTLNQHTHSSSFSRNVNLARKMNDPVFKAETLQTIIRQLINWGFSPDITAHDLNSPTKALYCAVMEFLMLRMDKTLVLCNEEEDIPRFFKDVCCPLAIAKSAVKAPGTPTTWPALLTAMAWLCELLQYDEQVLSGDIQGGPTYIAELDDDARTFDQILQLTHRMIISGKINAEQASNIIYAQCNRHHDEMKNKLVRLESNFKDITDDNARLQQRLFDADEMRKKIAKFTDDSEKLRVAATKCKQKAVDESLLNKASLEKLTKKKQNMEELHAEINRLQSVVDSQEINIDEVIRIEEQMKQRRNTAKGYRDSRAAIEDETLVIDKQIQDDRNKVAAMSRDLTNSQSLILSYVQKHDGITTPSTLKSVRHLPNVILRIDDESLDSCVKRQTSTNDNKYDELELTKSLPPAKLSDSQMSAYRMSNRRVVCNDDDGIACDWDKKLLDISWKQLKQQICEILSTETAEVQNIIKETEEAERKREELLKDKQNIYLASRNMSKEINDVEKSIKGLRVKEERKCQNLNEDIDNLQITFESLEIDLSARVDAAQKNHQCLKANHTIARSAVRNELLREKNSVVQMVKEAAELRKECQNRISQMVSDSNVICRDYQRPASETARRFGIRDVFQ